MTSPAEAPSFAIIDGALCKLSRRGTVVRRHAPLGRAVLQFLLGEGRVFVLESGGGMLDGMPNVYCLDDRLHLLWMAEMPDPSKAVSGGISLDGGVLSAATEGGEIVRFSPETGRIIA